MAAAGISGHGRAELARVVGRGRSLVSVSDVVEVLDLDRGSAARRLARWAAQGWLRRVRRDLYVPVPVDAERPEAWGADPLFLADAVWVPCYFTGWTSANHWGLTDQVFRSTVVKTAARVRSSNQQLLDNDYVVTHTSVSSLEWGLRREWLQNRRIAWADPARTVIDVLDDPRLAGGIRSAAEFLNVYVQEHEAQTLIGYGDTLGNRTVFKRLGLLVEGLGIGDHDLIEACLERLSQGYPLLDPTRQRQGMRSRRWKLIVNAVIEPVEPA